MKLCTIWFLKSRSSHYHHQIEAFEDHNLNLLVSRIIFILHGRVKVAPRKSNIMFVGGGQRLVQSANEALAPLDHKRRCQASMMKITCEKDTPNTKTIASPLSQGDRVTQGHKWKMKRTIPRSWFIGAMSLDGYAKLMMMSEGSQFGWKWQTWTFFKGIHFPE